MSRSRTTLKHGAITGLTGAAAVAIWFFIYDIISGRPFYMPGMLGSASPSPEYAVDPDARRVQARVLPSGAAPSLPA